MVRIYKCSHVIGNQSIAVYTIQANRGATEQQLFAASNSIKCEHKSYTLSF